MAKKERNRRSARQARARERAEREAIQAAEAKATGTATKAVQKKEPAKAPAKKASGKPGFFQRVRTYLSDVRTEMKRVVWPSRSELRDYSIGVICMLIVFGVAVWLVDTGLVAVLVAFSGLRG